MILALAFLLFNTTFASEPNHPYLTNLPAPYSDVALLPEKWHGWFVNQKQLDNLFKRFKPKTVIELGSFLGLSTDFIAKRLPNDGKLYAVDHWLGSVEHQGRPDVAHLLPTLYEQFLSNMIHKQNTSKVVPVKMTTTEAASFLEDIKADLIYIDAAHDEASVYSDLTLYYPLLKENGIICGDDWGWPTVQKAVVRFAREHRIKIHSDHNFWTFEPKRS